MFYDLFAHFRNTFHTHQLKAYNVFFYTNIKSFVISTVNVLSFYILTSGLLNRIHVQSVKNLNFYYVFNYTLFFSAMTYLLIG